LFKASFPHYELIADDMIAEGDKVAVLARFRGAHKGELQGIAPTGKEVDVPFTITYRLAGGKIAQHWMSFDRMALMEHLGVAPARMCSAHRSLWTRLAALLNDTGVSFSR